MNVNEVAGFLWPEGPGLTTSETWFNQDCKSCTDVERSYLRHYVCNSTRSEWKQTSLNTAVENGDHFYSLVVIFCVQVQKSREYRRKILRAVYFCSLLILWR